MFAKLVVSLLLMMATAPAFGSPSRILHFAQIPLTESLVASFIDAQPELRQVFDQDSEGEELEPSPEARKELDRIAVKHGFTSFGQFDSAAYSIWLVLGGIDGDTKQYANPKDALLKDLTGIESDLSIPEVDRKQLIEELKETIARTEDVLPENIAIVLAHYDELLRYALQ